MENETEEAAGQGGGDLARAAAELRALESAAGRLSTSVRGGLTRALERAALGSRSLGGAMRGLAADMARAGLRAALRPVSAAATQGVASLASGAATALGGAVRGFAKGGVVDRPTFFGAGVAGEAGPEAILPLARGADGRLGVRGGGVTVNLTVNTPDAESMRRSGPQIATRLARAVARGQRRL